MLLTVWPGLFIKLLAGSERSQILDEWCQSLKIRSFGKLCMRPSG